ncbi:MAG: MFS transporter [Hamadaea sp.]|uniref:MFS transporter n=1 Tax=Hamadaea sp. TaxID=2024425 RepID=UPI0018117DCD|nr:MFS transporter [Hamadaea sp.]NUT22321.1 MFS transporter [Hamadaea sp.]
MSALTPLRHAPFRYLLLGRTTSMLGNSVAPMALAFAVLDLTGSVRDLGFVVAARSLTNVVFILFGGVLADRLPRRLVMIGSNTLAFATQGAVAVLLFTHTATFGLLMGLAAVNGLVAAFSFPAMSAIAGQVVPDEIRQQANALIRLSVNFVGIGGAAAGGLLVAAFGSGWSIAIDAASFALAAVFFSFIRVPSVRAAAAGKSTLRELQVGWREFVARPWLWSVVAGFCVLNMMLSAGLSVLGPSVADETFGRTAWGLVVSAELAGLALGGLVALRLRVRRFLLVGVIAMAPVAPVLLALGLAPYAPLLIALNLLAGIGIEIFGVSWETSMQRHVPADLLARVYSWDMLGSIVAVPIGQAIAGPVAAAVGTSTALVGAGVLSLLAVLGMVVVPAVRSLDNTPVPAPEATEEPATVS